MIPVEVVDKFFPTIIIVLNILAALVYAYHGRWGSCAFWTGATICNFAVVYMITKLG